MLQKKREIAVTNMQQAEEMANMPMDETMMSDDEDFDNGQDPIAFSRTPYKGFNQD
jgi:hypothetical protein